MGSIRPTNLRQRCFGWFVVTLALLVAPTGLGRGMLVVLIEGPCPPDCTKVDDHEEADEGHTAASEPVIVAEHAEVDHACVWQAGDDHCPPDCGDCTCCATATMAVIDFPALSSGVLEAFLIEWRRAPSPVRPGAPPGLFRPPKRSLASTSRRMT